MWLIKRKANDGVRQIIGYSLFSQLLWTDLRLGIFIIEIGSLLYIFNLRYRIFKKKKSINKIVINCFYFGK